MKLGDSAKFQGFACELIKTLKTLKGLIKREQKETSRIFNRDLKTSTSSPLIIIMRPGA